MKNLGDRIKQFREKHGFTQKELGEKLGVSAQAVSKWENNVNQPDISTIRSLCSIFGIGVDEFLQEKESPAILQPKTTQTAMPNPRKRFWIIFCAVALAFVVCFLCVVIPLSLRDKKPSPPSSQDASQDNPPLSSNDIYKKADPSVFFIEIELENGNKQGGSGFFIDDKGTAVTNYHVVQGGKRGKIILADGKEYALKYVLGKDKHSDLVAIQIDIENSTPVTLADSLDVETGDRVYAIGYPESFLLGVESSTFTEGIVSKASYTLEGVEYIQTNADITHGNSGGVLLNDKAEVVGITTGAIQINGTNYMNLALPANNILRIDKTEYVLPLDKFTEKLREYTVHFMNADLEYDTRKVLSGEQAEKINSPVPKTGYTFTGWHTDKNATLPYDFDREVTEDLWLYAGWKANRYTLTFAKGAENANGTVADINAEYDQSVTLPDCGYELTDYRFAGWTYDGTTYQAGQAVKNLSSTDGDTITFTAVWEKVKKYTLTFEKGNGSATGNVADIVAEYGQNVTLPDCGYELTDYRFVGWAHGGNTYQAGQSVKNLSSTDGDTVTLTAVWEKIKRYTVTFAMGNDDAQGTLPAPTVIEVGEDYLLPTPSISCKGWNLLGWKMQDTSTVYAFNTSVCNLTEEDGREVTLVAVWERKQYDIMLAFDSSETENRSYVVSYGDTVTLPTASEAEKSGYTLTGWTWRGTTYPAGAVIENFYTDWQFAEFIAVWQGKTYSVKYIAFINETTSEFVVKEEQFVYGSGYKFATEIDGFEREGYKISAWKWKEQNKRFTAGSVASPLDENATVELYAEIAPITYSLIILDVNGEELRSQTIQYGIDASFENRVGIVTDGYYFAESGRLLNADKTEYTGDPRYVCTQQDGVVYLQPDWQEMVYDILLSLSWVDETGEQHSASMDENGNLRENTDSTYWITLTYSQEFILPTPQIDGYSFHGWEYYEWPPLGEPLRVYQGGDIICKLTESLGYDLTPTGKFVAKLTPYRYVVRYDGNGAQLGSMSDDTATYGEQYSFKANAYTKSGCTFGGWLYGDTLYSKTDTPYFVPDYDGEVIVLKANWISYEGAGTQESPYLISTYEDLYNLHIFMKEKPAFRSAHYLMTADIDCQGKILYSIDAYSENRFSDGGFSGVFDGGGHVIKNAVFAHSEFATQSNKSLFGTVEGGTIKNLGIVNYSMEQKASYASAPLIAGLHGGTVENCYAIGNFSSLADGYMGGLIARMTSGTVKNCKASGTISVVYDIETVYMSTFYIGGFLAHGAGTIEHCYTDMDITITAVNYRQIPRIYLGSFAGEIKGTPLNCIATGDMDLPAEFFESQYDAGDIFHGKFAGGIRRLDGSITLYNTNLESCYLSAEAIYNVEFAANDNVTTKSSAELNSLSWLKENLGFDDTVWTERNGEVLLSAFLRSGN